MALVAVDEQAAPAGSLWPVFLRLSGRKVVLVGGGNVAAAKLAGLRECGAEVTVVAPEILPEVAKSGATLVRRAFEDSDLDGAWFVVAAAPSDVNRRVRLAAEERRLFVNAVDDPASASAYLGGVFRSGLVTIAVSTNGSAPALAGLLREGLEAVVPDDIESWVQAARDLRARQRVEGVPMGDRRPALLRALNALYASRTASPDAAVEGRP